MITYEQSRELYFAMVLQEDGGMGLLRRDAWLHRPVSDRIKEFAALYATEEGRDFWAHVKSIPLIEVANNRRADLGLPLLEVTCTARDGIPLPDVLLAGSVNVLCGTS